MAAPRAQPTDIMFKTLCYTRALLHNFLSMLCYQESRYVAIGLRYHRLDDEAQQALDRQFTGMLEVRQGEQNAFLGSMRLWRQLLYALDAAVTRQRDQYWRLDRQEYFPRIPPLLHWKKMREKCMTFEHMTGSIFDQLNHIDQYMSEQERALDPDGLGIHKVELALNRDANPEKYARVVAWVSAIPMMQDMVAQGHLRSKEDAYNTVLTRPGWVASQQMDQLLQYTLDQRHPQTPSAFVLINAQLEMFDHDDGRLLINHDAMLRFREYR